MVVDVAKGTRTLPQHLSFIVAVDTLLLLLSRTPLTSLDGAPVDNVGGNTYMDERTSAPSLVSAAANCAMLLPSRAEN